MISSAQILVVKGRITGFITQLKRHVMTLQAVHTPASPRIVAAYAAERS